MVVLKCPFCGEKDCLTERKQDSQGKWWLYCEKCDKWFPLDDVTSKLKITDVWKLGVDPVSQELVIYPRGERPPYPKGNECPECWRRECKLVTGILERTEFPRVIFRIYDCPVCHHRWEGQRTKRR